MKAIFTVLFLAAAVSASVPRCPSKQETDWSIELLLRHEDCEKFWKCTFGQPVEQACYNGLYFNLETWHCDWPFNVDCADRNIPGEEKEEKVTSEPELEEASPEAEEEVVEKESAEEEVEEAVEEEVEEAVEEAEEVTEEVEEEVEEVVEEVEEAVEVEEEVKESEEVVKESEEVVKESEEAVKESEEAVEEDREIEFLENGCPVSPHVHWLLPHEEDCGRFYYCVWGEKVLRECAATLHFNRVLQVCDWPADAGCYTSANKHYAARVAYRS